MKLAVGGGRSAPVLKQLLTQMKLKESEALSYARDVINFEKLPYAQRQGLRLLPTRGTKSVADV